MDDDPLTNAIHRQYTITVLNLAVHVCECKTFSFDGIPVRNPGLAFQ